MKKLAVFVEGFTELLFVEKLIFEIAGSHNIRIETRQIRGGSKAPRTMTVVNAAREESGEKFYVLVYDCGGDNQVKTRILEEHANLTRSGYAKIIGIRDVRPSFSFADIPRLETGLKKYVKTSLIPVEFILAVMEIEAWFLAEVNHYAKIDPSITVEKIKATLGFDPLNDDLANRDCPAVDLDASYRIGGKSYDKQNVNVTVNAIDYTYLYINLQHRISYLQKLTSAIDGFLA